MFVFAKRKMRAIILSLSLLILFAAISSVCGFTLAYRLYIGDNAARMADTYTTIAVLNIPEFEETISFPNGLEIRMLSTNLLQAAYNFVNRTDTAKLDGREILRGVLGEEMPTLSGTFDSMKYERFLDKPRGSAAFVVTCEAVELWHSDDLYNHTNILFKSGRAHYRLTFAVDETLLLHSGYEAPETLRSVHWAFTENGEVPFEIGKQYLIFGNYEDIPLNTRLNPKTLQYERVLEPNVYESLVFFDNMKTEMVLVGDYYAELEAAHATDAEINGRMDRVYCADDESIATFCVPIDKNASEAISSNPFLTRQLEIVQKNISSAYVLTTDRMGSILHFNLGVAWITAGRGFSNDEAQNGAAVCVIHKDFAEYNGIEVGAMMSLELYDGMFSYEQGNMIEYSGLRDTDRMRGSFDVEVIGIYAAPNPESYDYYQLTANTIILPSNAVPEKRLNPDDYGDDDEERQIALTQELINIGNPAFFTAIISAGKSDEFIADAAEAGLENGFLVSDQGYDAIEGSLVQLDRSALTLFRFSLILLPVAVLVLVALSLRERHEIGL
ncbi:MAG: hypothetical protein FWH17_09210, partial [Oscillospiraceae bacterium]|nr:hypothetical protein [Oscillospiraceae bacterium]